MTTTFPRAIALLSAILLLIGSCSQDNTSHEEPKASATTRFDLTSEPLELEDLEAYTASRALSYDKDNKTTKGIHRLATTPSTITSPTFFFSNLGRTMVGYADLVWTLKKESDGRISVTCKADIPVYKATYNYGQTTIDRNTTVKLLSSTTYKMLAIIGDGVLELGMPEGNYTTNGTVGPRVSFSPDKYSEIFKGGYLQNFQGTIPYSCAHDITPSQDDYLKFDGIKFQPNVTVLRLEIDNKSKKALTHNDINLVTEGITSDFNIGFYRNYNTPSIKVWAPYTPETAMNKNTVAVPIASLAPNDSGTYFLPVTLTNGDAGSTIVTRVTVKANSSTPALKIVQPGTDKPINYELRDQSLVQKTWLNTGGQYKVKVLKLEVKDALGS